MTKSLQECLNEIKSIKESILTEGDEILEKEKELLSKNVGKWVAAVSYSGDDEAYFLHKDGTWQPNNNPCHQPDFVYLDDYILFNSPAHAAGFINRAKQAGHMHWPNVNDSGVFTGVVDDAFYEVWADIIPPLRYDNYNSVDDMEFDISNYCQEHFDECHKEITNDVNFVEDMKQRYGAK